MIRFYDFNGKLLKEINENGFCEFPYGKRAVILYIDYIKNDNTSFDISYDVFNEKTDKWYPIQEDVGTITVYKRIISDEGKYRLIVPISESERAFRVNIELSGGVPDLEIYAIPDYDKQDLR